MPVSTSPLPAVAMPLFPLVLRYSGLFSCALAAKPAPQQRLPPEISPLALPEVSPLGPPEIPPLALPAAASAVIPASFPSLPPDASAGVPGAAMTDDRLYCEIYAN